MGNFLHVNYDFTYLGFEVSMYPSLTKGQLSISIFDPLHGAKLFNFSSEQITENVMQFVMEKVREQIANDEEM